MKIFRSGILFFYCFGCFPIYTQTCVGFPRCVSDLWALGSSSLSGVCMRHDSLYTSIVDVTVWHLGRPNYMLVSSFCFPYLCVKLLYLFSSVHIAFYIAFVTYHYLLNICIIFCDNWPLARYVLQLILVFTCNSCNTLMPYIPSLWVQFF